MLRRVWTTLILFLVVLIVPLDLHAQLGIATIAYAGKTVRQILGEAEGAANTLLNNARQQSNLVLADGGNELQVMAKNIRYLLSGELDKRFEQLNDDERNFLAGLNEIINATNQQTGKIERMADFVSMDVDKYLQRLPGTEKHPFYVRRIENVVLRKQRLP